MRRIFIFAIACIICLTATSQKKTEFSQKAGISIQVPFINGYSFYDYHTGKTLRNVGLMGIGVGFFYAKGRNKYSLNGILSEDFTAVPEAARHFYAWTLEGVVHHRFGRYFSGILGVNYTNYKYSGFHEYYNSPDFNFSQPTLGPTLGAECTFSKTFSLGFVFRPAVYSFDTKSTKYLFSFLVNFDKIIWKK